MSRAAHSSAFNTTKIELYRTIPNYTEPKLNGRTRGTVAQKVENILPCSMSAATAAGALIGIASGTGGRLLLRCDVEIGIVFH